MHANRAYQDGSLRPRGSIAISFGAAAGGMLVAAFAQLAAAPDANADVTAIVNELDATSAVASTASTNALDSFEAGNVPFGLDYGFGALDTDLTSYVGDLLYGGYESLEGVPGPYLYFGFPYIENPVPLTLTAATADVTTDLQNVQTDFASAATAFSSDNIATGAVDTGYGIGSLIEAPEVYVIGLADALSGSV